MKTCLSPKASALLILFFFISNFVFAGTYYSNSTDPTNVNSWWTNTNGTGSHPANFTTSGDIFILQSGQTCATAASWTIGAGVTLQVSGTLSINGNNDAVTINGTIVFTNSAATQVTMAGAGGGNSITINGTVKTVNLTGLQGTNCSLPANAAKKTVTLAATASYEFNGGATQGTAGLPASIANLNINNAYGVNLGASTTITNTLTLSSGVFAIPTGMTLNISSGNAISGSGFGNIKHISTQVNTGTGAQGFLRVGNISAAYTFPVGNGTYYLPVTLTPTTTSDFSVNTFQGATLDGTPNGTSYSIAAKLIMVDAQWMINRNSGTGNATMQLAWPSALEGTSFSAFSNSQIGITHYTGSSWDAASGSGDNTANTATRSGISSFSPFGVSQNSTILPLKFGNIKLSQKNNDLEVDWTSLNEVNVDHYEIEKSSNGQQFNSTIDVKAVANNSSQSYSWLDRAPINGTSFYRIKAVDMDGKYIYSAIMKIALGQFKKDISIYPNPVIHDHFAVEVGNIEAGRYQFTIYDVKGRQLFNQTFNHTGGIFSQTIELPSTIGRGLYSLKLSGEKVSLTKSFLVQ